MKTLLRALVEMTLMATLAVTGGMGLASETAVAPSETRITAKQFHEDLDFMRRTIAQIHPDLHFSTDPAALDRAMHQLAKQSAASMTQGEAWRSLATLNPLLADGHFFIGFPDWRNSTAAHLRAGNTLFPYEVEFRDGSPHISSLLGGADTPLRGAKIIAINGESADKVASTLLKRIHGETPLFRAKLLAQRWWLYYWKMFGAAAHYQLTIARGNDISSIDTPGAVATPALLRGEAEFDQQFHLAIEPDGGAVLTIHSFAPDDREKFLAFTLAAFTKLRQTGAKELTIDISANGGGDDATWLDGLMPYLATRAYRTGSTYKRKVTDANIERGELTGQVISGSIETWHAPQPDNPLIFRGKTLVTIGPGTYSSAVLFANVMRDFCFGTLVGQGGAARQTQSGGVRQFILPNSKLALWVPRFVLDPPVATAPDTLLEPALRTPSRCHTSPTSAGPSVTPPTL